MHQNIALVNQLRNAQAESKVPTWTAESNRRIMSSGSWHLRSAVRKPRYVSRSIVIVKSSNRRLSFLVLGYKTLDFAQWIALQTRHTFVIRSSYHVNVRYNYAMQCHVGDLELFLTDAQACIRLLLSYAHALWHIWTMPAHWFLTVVHDNV